MLKEILGLDASLTNTGYCALKIADYSIAEIEFGSVKTYSTEEMGKRLDKIGKRLSDVIAISNIDEVAKERSFSNNRIASTQKIFMVNGFLEWYLWYKGFSPIVEYAPTTVKKQITGDGKADKKEVQRYLSGFLGYVPEFKNEDESDAVAVAITHAIKQGYLL